MDNRTWLEKLMTRFWQWLARRLPDRLVYFAVMRAWTYAVSLDGKVTTHDPITVSVVLSRWYVRMRDG